MAIGKVADVASLFDVGLDSRFDGVVSLGENGKIGRPNMLTNPRIETDTTGWVLDTGVTRDTSRMLNGCYSFKSGLSADAWRGVNTHPSYRPACAVGDVLTASIYVYIADYTTFGGGSLNFSVRAFNAAGTQVQALYAPVFTPAAADNGKWKRLTVTMTVTASDAVTAYVKAQIIRNGTAWFACPKLEKGSLATEFVANIDGDATFNGAVNLNGAVGFADPAAVLAALGVQKGAVAYSVGATTAANYTVTFARAYATPPQVLLTMDGSSSWTQSALGAITYTVTETGFGIRVMNGYSATRAGNIQWRAEGVLA